MRGRGERGERERGEREREREIGCMSDIYTKFYIPSMFVVAVI